MYRLNKLRSCLRCVFYEQSRSFFFDLDQNAISMIAIFINFLKPLAFYANKTITHDAFAIFGFVPIHNFLLENSFCVYFRVTY